jgi:biopolymer transport protein ExbB/TolQ
MQKPGRKRSLFFATVSRTSLAINKASAGAGLTALLGFLALFVFSVVFLITENFFLGMLMLSLALLVYVTGAELSKLFLSTVTLFFSSKHVLPNAAYIQETLVPMKKFLKIRRDASGSIEAGPVEPGAVVMLPDNPLARDVKTILDRGKGYDYLEYTAHTYYNECHELYDFSASHYEFVASAMPLLGLVGTILGLIGMFDGLGSEVSVEYLTPQLAIALKSTLYGAVYSAFYKILGSRFEQRLRALDYDYESFCRALEVMVENKARAEIQP